MTKQSIMDDIQQQIQKLTAQGKSPKTLVIPPEAALTLGLPKWTKQFLGMKCVIAQNYDFVLVSEHLYQTTSLKKHDNHADYAEFEQKKLIEIHKH